MGQSNSAQKKPTKETRTAIAVARDARVAETTSNIMSLQREIIGDSRTTAIMEPYMTDLLAATLVAKKQLARGGDSLTKDDLVHIVMLLKTIETGTSWFEKLGDINSMTRENLVGIIRASIYEPTFVKNVIGTASASAPAYAPTPAPAQLALVDSGHFTTYPTVPKLSNIRSTALFLGQ